MITWLKRSLLIFLVGALFAAPVPASDKPNERAPQQEDEWYYGLLKTELVTRVETGVMTAGQMDQFLDYLAELSTQIAAVEADHPMGVEMKIRARLEELGLQTPAEEQIVGATTNWFKSRGLFVKTQARAPQTESVSKEESNEK